MINFTGALLLLMLKFLQELRLLIYYMRFKANGFDNMFQGVKRVLKLEVCLLVVFFFLRKFRNLSRLTLSNLSFLRLSVAKIRQFRFPLKNYFPP